MAESPAVTFLVEHQSRLVETFQNNEESPTKTWNELGQNFPELGQAMSAATFKGYISLLAAAARNSDTRHKPAESKPDDETQNKMDRLTAEKRDMEKKFAGTARQLATIISKNNEEKKAAADLLLAETQKLRDMEKKFAGTARQLANIISKNSQEKKDAADRLLAETRKLEDVEAENKRLASDLSDLRQQTEPLEQDNARMAKELDAYQKRMRRAEKQAARMEAFLKVFGIPAPTEQMPEQITAWTMKRDKKGYMGMYRQMLKRLNAVYAGQGWKK